MKTIMSKINYLFFILLIFNFLKLEADDSPLKNIVDNQSQIFIEANNQRSDLKNSIFYAEGDVIITDKNFIAKSKKAIFYKSTGKIKLIGDAEVVTNDSSKIRAGEILYYLKENKFEAISDLNQRVNTKFVFPKNKISEKLKGK